MDDCEIGEVNLDLVLVDDCSFGVLISNDFFYVNVIGVDVSGFYLFGMIVVIYFVLDCCGNVFSCEIKVMVRDDEVF